MSCTTAELGPHIPPAELGSHMMVRVHAQLLNRLDIAASQAASRLPGRLTRLHLRANIRRIEKLTD